MSVINSNVNQVGCTYSIKHNRYGGQEILKLVQRRVSFLHLEEMLRDHSQHCRGWYFSRFLKEYLNINTSSVLKLRS